MLVTGLGVLMLFPPTQLEPLDPSLLQQKPNVNAVATLEKVIEIQSETLRPGSEGGTWTLPGSLGLSLTPGNTEGPPGLILSWGGTEGSLELPLPSGDPSGSVPDMGGDQGTVLALGGPGGVSSAVTGILGGFLGLSLPWGGGPEVTCHGGPMGPPELPLPRTSWGFPRLSLPWGGSPGLSPPWGSHKVPRFVLAVGDTEGPLDCPCHGGPRRSLGCPLHRGPRGGPQCCPSCGWHRGPIGPPQLVPTMVGVVGSPGLST